MNEITVPPGTSAEDAQLLVAAEMRRREKAALFQDIKGTAAKEPLEAALARLERLQNIPAKVIESGQSEQIKSLLAKAEISPRHNIEIPDGTDPWNEKRAKLVSQLGNGFLHALVGTQGVGKTQLGTALIYAAAARRMTCKYAVAMDFFIALKASFDDESKSSESSVIAAFVKPKLLVLDECDERSESPWENRLLFHMLNKRYNAMLDTLLISRRSKEEFLTSLGESIQSRLQEVGACIQCNWPSYRETKE